MLAPSIYVQFLSGSISEKVETALTQSGGDLAVAVQGMSFLPDTVRQTLATLLQGAGNALPEQITAALEPVLLPFVQVVLFVVFCMVVRWVFRLLVGILEHVNGIPLLGASTVCSAWYWAWRPVRSTAGCWRWCSGSWPASRPVRWNF